MKSRFFTAFIAATLCAGALAQTPNPPPVTPPAAPLPEPTAPDKATVSTALGELFAVNAIRQLESYGLEVSNDLDPERFSAAVANIIAGKPHLLSNEVETNVVQREIGFARARVVVETQKMKATGPENKAKGEKFIAENAKQPGVIVLTNGLQYKILQPGAGAYAAESNLVSLNVRITSIDGEEYLKLEDIHTDNLRRVLPPGIDQALEMMQQGAKWIVYLPPNLAYGDKVDPLVSANRAPRFGPDTALIWEIEVVSVAPRPARPQPTPSQTSPMRGMPPTSSVQVPGPSPNEHISSSQIVRIPSADEYARGKTNPEVGSLEYFQKQQAEAAAKAGSNNTASQTHTP